MIFLLYSTVDENTISASLGTPDYSYYFVMRGFQSILEKLGTVRIVSNPAIEIPEIIAAYEATAKAQEKPVTDIKNQFLFFT